MKKENSLNFPRVCLILYTAELFVMEDAHTYLFCIGNMLWEDLGEL